MSIKLALGLVDEIVSYLTTNLQTYLTAEEEIWDDGISLPMPNAIIRRDPDDPRRMNNPPYLYIVVARSQMFDWRSGYASANHQLVSWLVAQDSDVEQLRKMIYRYGNALWKTLVAADDDAGVTYDMALPSAAILPDLDYGETLTRGSVAMGDVRVVTWWSGSEND